MKNKHRHDDASNWVNSSTINNHNYHNNTNNINNNSANNNHNNMNNNNNGCDKKQQRTGTNKINSNSHKNNNNNCNNNNNFNNKNNNNNNNNSSNSCVNVPNINANSKDDKYYDNNDITSKCNGSINKSHNNKNKLSNHVLLRNSAMLLDNSTSAGISNTSTLISTAITVSSSNTAVTTTITTISTTTTTNSVNILTIIDNNIKLNNNNKNNNNSNDKIILHDSDKNNGNYHNKNFNNNNNNDPALKCNNARLSDERQCLNDNSGFSLVKQKKKNNNHNNTSNHGNNINNNTHNNHNNNNHRKSNHKDICNNLNCNPNGDYIFQQHTIPISEFSTKANNKINNNNNTINNKINKIKVVKSNSNSSILLNGYHIDANDDDCIGEDDIDSGSVELLPKHDITNRITSSSTSLKIVADDINPRIIIENNDDEDDGDDNGFKFVNHDMLSGSFESCHSSVSSVSSLSNNCINNNCDNSFITCSANVKDRVFVNSDISFNVYNNVDIRNSNVSNNNDNGNINNISSITTTNNNLSSPTSYLLNGFAHLKPVENHPHNTKHMSIRSPLTNNKIADGDDDDNDNDIGERTSGAKLDVLSSFHDNIGATFKPAFTTATTKTITTTFTTCSNSSLLTLTRAFGNNFHGTPPDFFNTLYKSSYSPIDADLTFGDFSSNIFRETSSNSSKTVNNSENFINIIDNLINDIKVVDLSAKSNNGYNNNHEVNECKDNYWCDNMNSSTFLTTTTSPLSMSTQHPTTTMSDNHINFRFASLNDANVTNFNNNFSLSILSLTKTTSTTSITFSTVTSTFLSLTSSTYSSTTPTTLTTLTTTTSAKSSATKLPPVEFLYTPYVPCSSFDITFGMGLEDLISDTIATHDKNTCHTFENIKANIGTIESAKIELNSIPTTNIVQLSLDNNFSNLQTSYNKIVQSSSVYGIVSHNPSIINYTKNESPRLICCSNSTTLVTIITSTVAPTMTPTISKINSPLNNGFIESFINLNKNSSPPPSTMVLVLTTAATTLTSPATTTTNLLRNFNFHQQQQQPVSHKMDELDDCSCCTNVIKNSNGNVIRNNYNNTNDYKSNGFMPLKRERFFNLSMAQQFLHNSYQKSYSLYVANNRYKTTATAATTTTCGRQTNNRNKQQNN